MNLLIASDLHIEFDSRGALPAMAAAIAGARPDAFVIAGDLAHSAEGFAAVLDIFAEVPEPRAVLVGNHDLWCSLSQDYPKPTSRSLFKTVLPGLARARGWIWLEDNDLALGETVVVGSTGWYDYSVALLNNPRWTLEDCRNSKAAFNNDGVYMDPDWDDLEFAGSCADRLAERLARHEADPAVKRVVVVTHVPVFLEQRVRHLDDNAMADGYFYNLSLGRRIASFSKVTHVVSGHTHRNARGRVRRPGMKSIDARVVGSEYGSPAFEKIS